MYTHVGDPSSVLNQSALLPPPASGSYTRADTLRGSSPAANGATTICAREWAVTQEVEIAGRWLLRCGRQTSAGGALPDR